MNKWFLLVRDGLQGQIQLLPGLAHGVPAYNVVFQRSDSDPMFRHVDVLLDDNSQQSSGAARRQGKVRTLHHRCEAHLQQARTCLKINVLPGN